MPLRTLIRESVSLFWLTFSPTNGFARGNWGVDLQAGSEYGYKLLFVVLLAGLFAVLLQVFDSHKYTDYLLIIYDSEHGE